MTVDNNNVTSIFSQQSTSEQKAAIPVGIAQNQGGNGCDFWDVTPAGRHVDNASNTTEVKTTKPFQSPAYV